MQTTAGLSASLAGGWPTLSAKDSGSEGAPSFRVLYERVGAAAAIR